MSNELCSVIIPAHNAERFLAASLKSVLAQTYTHWECIVVDDASTDGTEDIARQYAALDGRFRVLKNEKNLGAAGSRNRGISAAKGDYIAFLDADDIYVPKKLKKSLKLLKKSGAPMVCSSYLLIDESSRPLDILSRCSGRITRERLVRSNEIGCSTVILKRSVALSHPFDGSYFHEDYACWLSIAEDCGAILGIDEPLTLYRFMKGTKSRGKLRSANGVYEIYRKFLRLSPPKCWARMLCYFVIKLKKYLFTERPYERRIPVVLDDIIFSLQKAGGVSTYWAGLISAMSEEDRYAISHIERDDAAGNICRDELSYALPASESGVLPLNLARFIDPRRSFSEPTICHSSYYRTIRGRHAINIVTIYDFTYEWLYDGFVRFIHVWQQKRAAKKADVIICISENTKRDLLSLVPCAAKKDIRVIPLGYDDSVFYFDPDCARKKQVVFVGARAEYKNFDAAVDAVMKNGRVSLAVVGSPLTDEEGDELNDKLRQRHFHVAYPSNTDLRHIYNSSVALIYISQYEGFGLPILEAMASGCPVISLNTSSQPEVAGEAGILLDDPNSDLISSEIDKLISDEDYFRLKVEQGLERAKQFPWSKCVSHTLDLYRELTGK